MHHPGCWVTNGGCATEAPHRSTPTAMAYSSGDRLAGNPQPHPGVGTRSAADQRPDTSDPIPFRQGQLPRDAGSGDDIVIGASEPRAIHHTLPASVGVPPPTRRYQPPPGEPMPRRQLPKIYDRHPLLGYWYVPAAA